MDRRAKAGTVQIVHWSRRGVNTASFGWGCCSMFLQLFGLLFPGESQLRQSRATQPTVHAGCFRVSIIHRTLTWTTGSLTCAQMLMHAIAHGGVRTHVRESALKVDSPRKIPCRTGELNLRQQRDGLML